MIFFSYTMIKTRMQNYITQGTKLEQVVFRDSLF